MTRKLIALVLTFLLGITLDSMLRNRHKDLLSANPIALKLRMPEGCQYAPAMDDGYVDVPPRIFCDHNLDGYEWQRINGYAYYFFVPGTEWDLVLPEGVKHMRRPPAKYSMSD